MAFPTSPTNGQTAVVNDITYVYDSTFNTWTIVPGSALVGGLDTQVQFNDGGSFAGDSGLTYNKSTDVLTVTGGVIAGSINLAPTLASAYDHANAAFNAANTSGGVNIGDVLALSIALG